MDTTVEQSQPLTAQLELRDLDDCDNSKTERRNVKVKAVMVFLSHIFLALLEKGLEKAGLFLSRRQFPVILMTLFILLGLCLGFLRVEPNVTPPRLYENDHSQDRQRLMEAQKTFGTLYSWKVTIYVSSNSSGNVLSSSCLEDAGRVHNWVTNTSWFQNRCVLDSNGNCATNTPLILKGLKKKDVEILTSSVQNKSIMHVNEALKLYNVSLTIDDVSAQAISISYFMRKPNNNKERNEFKDFWSKQKALISRKRESGIHCASIHVLNTTIYDENLWRAFLFESLPLLCAIPVFFFLGFILMAFQSNGFLPLSSIPFLLACISVGFVSAIGICNFGGIAFQEFYVVVPCFLLSKAFTDALLLLRAFIKASDLPSCRRASSCLTTAGLVVTVSSIASCILFAFPIWSSFDAVAYVFVLALASMILTYFTVLTLFLTVLFWVSKRSKRKIKPSQLQSRKTTESGLGNKFVKYVVRFLISVPGKILLSFFVVGLLAFCIIVLATRNLNFRTVDSMGKSSKAMDKIANGISSTSVEDVSILFTKQLNYSSQKSRSNLIAFINKFKIVCDNKCGETPTWLESFEIWKKVNGKTCPVNKFNICLGEFLNQNVTSIFQSDIMFKKQDNASQIQTSRVRFPIQLSSDSFRDISTLHFLQEKLRNSMFRDNAKLLSEGLLVLEDFQTFLSESLWVLIFLIVVLTLCLFPLTSSTRTTLALFFTMVMQVLEVLTIISLLDVPFNPLTFTCIYPAFVFSFSASIYVSETFIISKKGATQDGIIEALEINVVPLLSGLGLTISTSVALGFSFPFLSIVFLYVIPVVILLGTVHAFIILPCILCTLGNSRKPAEQSLLPILYFNARGFNRRRNGSTRYVISDNKKSDSPEFPSVSIVGISCRFPQASSKAEFWDMLKNGRCCISSFPENRPEEFRKFKEYYHPNRFVSGRLCTLGGGFLDNMRKFDAGFFGISHQEANAMDPQQRILLQVTYEAIEDSGMILEDLQACKTGVFVGLMNQDFNELLKSKSNLRNIDQFASTGISSAIVANRISFCFDFKGPSLTVDTACSSSLTAFTLAVDSLRNGDCEVALVCAPNLILNYISHLTTGIAGLLAPDGRCKSFDSSGDGYGRGEGFAALVLKLSEQAKRDKDDVYCDMVACGLNNDGANAVPITAPSSQSQANLFRTVLERSGLKANDIDYIEAHGTGTAIGDVVETTSIADVYGTKSSGDIKRILRIGSVKSNLNHTESTSGLAGVVKLALMIKHGCFVPTINIQQINPKLDLEGKGLVVQESFEPWECRSGKLRIGAVNSYGFGGSNGHVILREATCPKASKSLKLTCDYCNGTNIIALSARSLNALRESALLHSQWLLDDENLATRLRDVCFSLNERRSVHPYRLAIAFKTVEEATSALNAFNEDSSEWLKIVSIGEGVDGNQKLVFMFGGQGAQWYGMGRQLIEKEKVVIESIEEINNLLKEFGEEWILKKELLASEEDSKVDQLVIGQIATFSIQLAIARLLISWGIYPAAVVGHSLGEFAAACIAGSLTLKETLAIVLLRAKLQLACPEDGAMAALGMCSEEARSLIEELKLEKCVEIAAYNDAKSVTLSGDKLSIECIGNYLDAKNVQVFWRKLKTSRAFHSSQMDQIENSFKVAAQKEYLKPKDVAISFYSTVEGTVVRGKKLDCIYWWENIRNPVKFHQAMKSILSDGYTKLVEIGAQPTLAHYVKQIAVQEEISDERKPVVISTLPRKTVKEQHKAFIQNTICKLHSLAYPIQWQRIRGGDSCSFVRSPTYPWQEKEYWYQSRKSADNPQPCSSEKAAQLFPPLNHPFLGDVTNAGVQQIGQSGWSVEIDLHRFSFLKDHALREGGAIMPAAAYIEMAFAMAKNRFLSSAIQLHNVRLWSLLTLPESQVRLLRLFIFQDNKLDGATFKITCVQENQTELTLSSGEISYDFIKEESNSAITQLHPTDKQPETYGPMIKALQDRMEEMPLEQFENITSRYGFSYGPCFSVIRKVWKGKSEGLCLVSVDNRVLCDEDLTMYVVHPSILDACLQSCFVPISGSEVSVKSIVPVSFKYIELAKVPIDRNVVCHVIMDAELGHFNVTLLNLSGKVILKMNEFQVTELGSSKWNTPPPLGDIIYEIQWKELSTDYMSQALKFNGMICVVLKDSRGLCASLIKGLKDQGAEVLEVEFPKSRDFLENEEKGVTDTLEFAIKRSSSGTKKLKVVSFWPSEADILPEDVSSIDQAQNIAFRSSVFVIREISRFINDTISGVQIVFITQGTCIVEGKDERSPHLMPWSSTVWGLRRTAALEYVNIEINTVDLSLVSSSEEINGLLRHLGSEAPEEEVALRGGRVFSNRIARLSDDIASGKNSLTSHNISEGKKFFLEQNPSSLEIFLREDTNSVKYDDEVVVQTLHLFSTRNKISSLASGSDDILGFSGIVFQSGSQLKAGDEVFGLTKPRRVGNLLTIKETHVIPRPQDLSLKESAYIPMCLVIAMEIVQKVTSHSSSMKILIHEVDAVLGFAAAIILKLKGHSVFCTVHREFQARKDVFLDNDLDVIADVSCIELCEKYDEFFDAVIYLSVPCPGSLQHSFRSIRTNGKLLLACNKFDGAVILPENKCIRYERIQVADLIDMIDSSTFKNRWFHCLNSKMLNVVIKALQNLPHSDINVFEAIQRWNDGFTEENVKNSVTRSYNFDNTGEKKAVFAGIDHFGLKENRSYIVAGGVRGFGFEVARWMCENGAKTVVLLARSRPSQDKLQEVAELEKKTGTNIQILQIDISCKDDITFLEEKLQDLPSVAGIVLTAMVLRDNLINLMDLDSFRDVMAPKVTGGYLLHKLSLKMDLDFFVLFSSMSSIVGNIGQASYSAANAYLDALASYRRHVLGLPGLSINWGPIGGAGVLTRENNITNLLVNVGLGLISAVEGPKYMGHISCYQPTRAQIVIFIADLPRLFNSNEHLSSTKRLELLRKEDSKVGAPNYFGTSSASRILLEKNASKRAMMIEEFVTSMLSSWAGLESLSELDLNTSLYNYGVDSAAALTLKMRLESSLQISFEVFYFMQPDTTPAKMVQDIIQRLEGAKKDSDENQTPTIIKENRGHEKPGETGELGETENTKRENKDHQQTRQTCQLVPLYKPEKAEIKFFCIHPSHRFAMSLASIAIGFESQDLVSFYAIGYTDPTERSDWGGVRELAQDYLDLILKEQRHGPYFIGGYSYGGLVGYEIACLLMEHGEQVEFVCMIDTFQWTPPSRGGIRRMASRFRTEFSPVKQVELQFNVYLEKLALKNLQMTKEEYDELLQQPTQNVMQALQARSQQINVPIYDLAALWESILNDHLIARSTHDAWELAATHYEGHVTYIKCQDRKFSPNIPLIDRADKAWNDVLPGPMDVMVCPGDHYSLSELPFARITGGIVVTAIGIKYRSLFPEIYHFGHITREQRKAIDHLKDGFPALMYSKQDRKIPKSGKLFLDEEKHILIFSQGEHSKPASKLNGKVIKLKELRCILAGRYVRKAIKLANRLNSSNPQQVNLYNVVSLFGKKRIFNVEFLSLQTLKKFCRVTEAIYKVKIDFF